MCPSTGSTAGFQISGYGFAQFNDRISCELGFVHMAPIAISDTTVTCPCLPLRSVIGPNTLYFKANDTLRVIVQMNLTIASVLTPVLSTNVTYYDVPKISLSTKRVMISRQTIVNLTFANTDLELTRNSLCQLKSASSSMVGTVIFSQRVSSNVLACGVLITIESLTSSNGTQSSETDALNSIMMQATLDGVTFFDAGVLDVISTPIIESYSPIDGLETG